MPDLPTIPARRTSLRNRKVLQKALGIRIPSLLVSQLELLADKVPNRGIAVYVRDRGRLILVAASVPDQGATFVEEVPVAQTLRFLEGPSDDVQEFARTLFVVSPPSASAHFEPLTLRGQASGLLVILNLSATPFAAVRAPGVRTVVQTVSVLVSSIVHLMQERRRSQRLSRINRICQSLETVQDEEKVYREIVRRIQKFFNYDHVAVYILDKRQNVLVLKTLAGKYRGITPDGQIIPLNQGIVGWVASHGKSLLSNDVSRTPFFLNVTPALTPTQAELCVPIRVDGELLGVLNIEHSELLHFDDDDINGIEVLADRIGVAISNSQLYAQLQRSHNRLQEIVSSIGQGLMMIDRNFRVLWLNKTLREWGYERMVGHACYAFFGQGQEFCRGCPGYRTLQTGLPFKDVIKASNDRHYAIASAPITDSAGNVTHVLEAFDDVTESMKTRGELQFLKGELERSQQLASLGELTASIVHEVRNPVNAMMQAVDILESELSLDKEQRQLMEVLREECNRLESTLSAFQSRTPRPARKMEECSLKAVAERVVNLLSVDHSVSRRVRFVVDFSKSVPPVMMHVNSITQVFWNLLLNAVESIDHQGHVTIRCRLDDTRILLSVEDSGRGLGETDLDRLYDPFYSTKEKGTGLGLAIVKRVLDDHGWSIRARPVPDGGTSFTITIPLATHPPGQHEDPGS